MDVGVFIIVFVLLAVLSGILGYIVRIRQYEGSLKKTETLAKEIIENAQSEAEKLKKETIAEGKLEIQNLKNEADIEIKSRKQVVEELEKKVNSREDALDRRSSNLDRREEILDSKELKLDDKRVELEALGSKAEELVAAQEAKLIEISNLTYDEARNIIMTKVRDDMSVEIATYIKDEEEKAKSEIHNRAKNMLALAIQKYASETTSEKTVSVVDLPSDEMKGRIIGREGRNIRAIESLTGVDLIIDDTPDAVVLSGFDPVRREIARKALQSLVSDGRIHPSRIEEVVERARAEVDTYIRECGEEAVFTANIGRVHPDLIKLLGRLNYRTSYGQNVLKHSIETAYLAGKLAAELGENETIARRAGLLHDIGKAVDHEVEGSHVEIGVSIANRYRECKEVVDAIASHHGDKEPECIISVLVAAADALSAARPGARSESLDNYVKRLEQLEKIGDSVPGVEKSFAVQAGREIRVMVKPSEIDDISTFAVARKIKEEIENNLSYPGTVKVTVIREIRATDVAK